MTRLVRHVECLSCSNDRHFVHHTDTGQRLVGQDEVAALGRRAVLTCGHCGGANLIQGWGDTVPYAEADLGARRRRRLLTAPATEDGAVASPRTPYTGPRH